MVKEAGMSLSGNLSGTDTNKMTLIQYEDLYLKENKIYHFGYLFYVVIQIFGVLF